MRIERSAVFRGFPGSGWIRRGPASIQDSRPLCSAGPPEIMTRSIHLQYRAPTGSEARRVAVAGELADWLNAIPMPLRSDGAFTLDVDLAVGVYAYKFLVDGAWTLDPCNPRTRSTDGHRNNVLVVCGTDEPVLHAPAPPFLTEMDGGGLRVVAAVRRTTSDRPVIRWT